ncbi:MAG: molybdopterin molybdotransferase MoeA [Phycisphaerales bacterium]|nr:molybdopterin molybdotransferase MoeA [Phycisphaerales bacterium]
MAHWPDYPEALAATLSASWQASATECIELKQASGRVLADPITADRDLPPFDRAAMDGYALSCGDLENSDALPCAGFISAGDADAPEVPEGWCVGIATGAPVPPGLDAVAPHEWTDRGDPVCFERKPVPGDSIHCRGSDAAQADTLVPSGTRLDAVAIGLAATVGASTVNVHRHPRVLVLSSGDEVVPIDTAPQPHQVRNSNLQMIAHLLTRMGADIIDARWLPDDVALAQEAISGTEADVVVTIGGISEGKRDAFRDAIESLGAHVLIRGAAIQPGRPIQVASMDIEGTPRPILSLPGNPVSAVSTACLFAWPVLKSLQGDHSSLPWTTGILGSSAQRHRSRRRFRPATLDKNGRLHVPHWQGSGDLAHAQGTAGLIDIAPGQADLPADSTVRWLPWP